MCFGLVHACPPKVHELKAWTPGLFMLLIGLLVTLRGKALQGGFRSLGACRGGLWALHLFLPFASQLMKPVGLLYHGLPPLCAIHQRPKAVQSIHHGLDLQNRVQNNPFLFIIRWVV